MPHAPGQSVGASGQGVPGPSCDWPNDANPGKRVRATDRRLWGRLVPPHSAKWGPRSYISSVQFELEDGDAIRGRNLNHEDSTGQQNPKTFAALGKRGREPSKGGLTGC